MARKKPSVDEVPGRRTTIADRIRWMMRAQELTQQDLAGAASMAPSQLSVLLKRLDERPFAVELETVGRLAQAGGVSPMWLLHGEGHPFRPGERAEEVAHPPLRRRPEWEPCIAALRAGGFLTDDRLVQWVGDVALPMSRVDRLTPPVILSLARVRQEMDLGGGLAAVPTTDLKVTVERRRKTGASRSKKPR